MFTDLLFEGEGFARLALDIKDDIERRFEMLGEVGLQRSSTGWPILWSFRSDDRTAFLRQVRWFSSNHFKQFGRLLTPLVDGLRVRGPFRPLIPELQCADRIVLIDGQGVGHAPETASSVSTRITKRFSEVDLVLIVDTSQHPMQAGPVSLLRAAGSAGYTDKIGVVFTHFDQVRGDNLQTVAQKRAHVIASITNAISSLRQILGAPVAAAQSVAYQKRCTSSVVSIATSVDTEGDHKRDAPAS